MFLTTRAGTAFVAWGAAMIVARSATAAEPTPTTEQCIAASEVGQALHHSGKLLEARSQFAVCVAESCPGPIREDCAQRLDDVGKAMPSVVFEVKDSAGNDVPGVAITMNGQPLLAGTGPAIERDPGVHTFTFAARGLPSVEKRVAFVEGVKERRVVVVVEGVKERGAAIGPGSGNTLSEPSKDEAPAWQSGPPTLAWAAFGVGGAGLALGALAGLVAGGKHSTLEDKCDNRAETCPPAYADELDSFHTWRTVSTVGYVVGALGAAGGAVLWFTAPKERSAAATGVWLGPSSAGVAGRF